jgi:hypothetical protein
MRMCDVHWQMCKTVVALYGLESLVCVSQADLQDRLIREAERGPDPTTFDPLLALSNYLYAEALRRRGPQVLSRNLKGDNDGHYCPLCELAKTDTDFVSRTVVEQVVAQMADWARSVNLIPGKQ